MQNTISPQSGTLACTNHIKLLVTQPGTAWMYLAQMKRVEKNPTISLNKTIQY